MQWKCRQNHVKVYVQCCEAEAGFFFRLEMAAALFNAATFDLEKALRLKLF